MDCLLQISRKQADRLFVCFFLLLAFWQFCLIGCFSIPLSPDEAHYWEWSRNLDIAYYSKGPLIAWLIAGSRYLFGETEFAVRFPATVLYTLFSLIFYFFLRSFYSAQIALSCWITQGICLIFLQAGFLMTTDAPAAFFWLLALIFGALAIKNERTVYWIPFGLMLGLGIWGKYTIAILLPTSALFLLVTRKLRWHLLSLPFIGGIVSFALFLWPIIHWNIEHGWTNFAHNSSHLVGGTPKDFTPVYLLELLGGQLGLAGPFVFFLVGYALLYAWRRRKEGDLLEQFLAVTAFSLLLLVLVISLFKRVYANWPMPIYISGLVLTGHLMFHCDEFAHRIKQYAPKGVALTLLITIIAHLPLLGVTLGIPGEFLPTKKLFGWDYLGERVNELVAELPPGMHKKTFLMTDQYTTASELSFYLPTHPVLYCANVDSRRMNQYDIWHRRRAWRGLKRKDALIILASQKGIDELRPNFEQIEEIQPNPFVSFVYSGSLIKNFYVYWGRNYNGKRPREPLRR